MNKCFVVRYILGFVLAVLSTGSLYATNEEEITEIFNNLTNSLSSEKTFKENANFCDQALQELDELDLSNLTESLALIESLNMFYEKIKETLPEEKTNTYSLELVNSSLLEKLNKLVTGLSSIFQASKSMEENQKKLSALEKLITERKNILAQREFSALFQKICKQLKFHIDRYYKNELTRKRLFNEIIIFVNEASTDLLNNNYYYVENISEPIDIFDNCFINGLLKHDWQRNKHDFKRDTNDLINALSGFLQNILIKIPKYQSKEIKKIQTIIDLLSKTIKLNQHEITQEQSEKEKYQKFWEILENNPKK